MRRAAFLMALLAACGGEEHDHDHDGHEHGEEHAHEPKWGGRLVELGDHFANVEVVHEPETGTLTLYVLDAHAQKAVRIAAPSLRVTVTADGRDTALDLKAVADPLTGEKPGDTSRFEASADALTGVGTFRGRIERIEVSGQAFTGVAFTYEGDDE